MMAITTIRVLIYYQIQMTDVNSYLYDYYASYPTRDFNDDNIVIYILFEY